MVTDKFVKLNTLDFGAIFFYEGCFYMKIYEPNPIDYNIVSCFNIDMTELEYINKEEQVETIPKAKLRLHIAW